MLDRLIGALKKGHQDDTGITGLETAIILIAFVSVAAIFGYCVLSAGIFSAEKGKEAVYVGLEETKSTLELKGSFIVEGYEAVPSSGNYTKVQSIKFNVANIVSGEPIDMTDKAGSDINRCLVAYADLNQYHGNLNWKRTWVGYNDGDKLLERGEQAEITVWLITDAEGADPGYGNVMNDLSTNTQFTIEFKPPRGAVVTVEKTTPPDLDKIMNLH